MKIHEYQARDLVASYGVPVNAGDATDSPQTARTIAERSGFPVMVKAQVLTGGRGKAGGVKKAEDADQAESLAKTILGMTIKGYPVTKVLIVRALPIYREYYIGITVDRTRKRAVLIASASGGMDIEELAVREPDKILTLPIDPLKGLDPGPTRELLRKVVTDEQDAATADRLTGQAVEAVSALYKLFRDKDCSLVEVNPYALTGEPDEPRRLAALDAKIVFDDNALYRHPEIEGMRQAEEYSPEEIEARQAGLSFVGLDGEIGCIVNGAGLAMATMDLIKLAGGSPANFLDVGGSSNPQKVLTALRIILRNPKVKAILINIFGGITRCDDIARGILMARHELHLSSPLVIRLIGTNEMEGRKLLQDAGLAALERLGDAVRTVVDSARARGAKA